MSSTVQNLTLLEQQILEFMEEYLWSATFASIYRRVDFLCTRAECQKALKRLVEIGLVEKHKIGKQHPSYCLTQAKRMEMVNGKGGAV